MPLRQPTDDKTTMLEHQITGSIVIDSGIKTIQKLPHNPLKQKKLNIFEQRNKSKPKAKQAQLPLKPPKETVEISQNSFENSVQHLPSVSNFRSPGSVQQTTIRVANPEIQELTELTEDFNTVPRPQLQHSSVAKLNAAFRQKRSIDRSNQSVSDISISQKSAHRSMLPNRAYKLPKTTTFGKREMEVTQDAKKFLLGFSDERIAIALQNFKNGTITTDLRQIQSAIYVSSINTQINDYHKSFIGSDMSSAWPHYLWISLWVMLASCAITLSIVFGWIKVMLEILSYMFYFFISLEYILMFAALKTGQYPTKPVMGEDETVKIRNNKICLIIPVGWGIGGLDEQQKIEKRQGKIDVLTNTIDAANDVFEAQDIFIFHNSSDQVLPDEVMFKCCENRSIYVPIAMGSKSIAAYYGALLGQHLGYEYCIVMDDDTRLPRELGIVLNSDLKDDAYCMAIAASSNDDLSTISNKARLLIGLQDIEYKLSDLAKLTQSNWSNTASVLAPHGAINMWRTNMLTIIMNEHNCIFHGEDYQMGLIMRMKWPKSKLGIISNCIINTVAPATLKELYFQRYTSWDLAAQQFLWGGFCASQRSAHYMQVLFCLPCSVDNIYLRITTLEDVWTVMQDYLRVVLLSYHIITSMVWGIVNIPVMVMYLVVLGSQWVIAWCLQYVKFGKRPDLAVEKQFKLRTVLIFPIYRFCFSFVRVAALCRFMLKFESIKRNATPIKQMNLPQPEVDGGLFCGSKEREDVDVEKIQQVIKMTLEKVQGQRRNFVAGSYIENSFRGKSEKIGREMDIERGNQGEIGNQSGHLNFNDNDTGVDSRNQSQNGIGENGIRNSFIQDKSMRKEGLGRQELDVSVVEEE
ncbi:putative Glycosyltransferase [Spironucleus salmonicida]|uniref:Glycosyl transferase n=1 Tax=Spironucleus salmonicida TaxID=348837 RepID=V6LWT3_9EUKA|nr:putative Glycosyltransferase [Spironucleus salmonicida]|eukprot:EST49050.1 Glycosyl transferase [Spironucleus salmonicida]